MFIFSLKNNVIIGKTCARWFTFPKKKQQQRNGFAFKIKFYNKFRTTYAILKYIDQRSITDSRISQNNTTFDCPVSRINKISLTRDVSRWALTTSAWQAVTTVKNHRAFDILFRGSNLLCGELAIFWMSSPKWPVVICRKIVHDHDHKSLWSSIVLTTWSCS